MTIQPFAAGSYATERTNASLIGLKSRLDGLTRELSTGRRSETYGGLGSARTTSLSAHATIGALDGTIAGIDGATTRVRLATASLTQVKTLTDGLRTNLLNGIRSASATGIVQSTALARTSLDAAVDALNQQASGIYLFGGRRTDAAPVVSSDVLLNGDPAAGLDGLKALIAQQKTADLGPAGNGRLTQGLSGTGVSLSEDANAQARANFGFSLSALTSSGAGIGASLTRASAASVDLAFAQQPKEGERVRVAVLRPDGGQTIIDMTARVSAPAGSTDSFSIGADAAASAANLKAALGTSSIASVQSANPPGISATFSGGSPASLSLSVGTPLAGDSITLVLGMRDGTSQTITLTAASSAEAGSATSFAIGTSPAATAANLSAALDNAVKLAASTALAASSTLRASEDFFDGASSPGLAPRRIGAGGNGYAETASAGTVIWYRGEDDAADPRASASLRVGANQTIGIGARANEAPIRAALAGMAALAAGTYTDSIGAQDPARFQAAADRVRVRVTPPDGQRGIADIASEFGVAASGMAGAKTQAQSTRNTLQDALAGVETISTEEVAAKLLSLQTQLQASYQVTSTLSKLSLVNYLG